MVREPQKIAPAFPINEEKGLFLWLLLHIDFIIYFDIMSSCNT
jgi:hypothetical protein